MGMPQSVFLTDRTNPAARHSEEISLSAPREQNVLGSFRRYSGDSGATSSPQRLSLWQRVQDSSLVKLCIVVFVCSLCLAIVVGFVSRRSGVLHRPPIIFVPGSLHSNLYSCSDGSDPGAVSGCNAGLLTRMYLNWSWFKSTRSQQNW